jgi:hypothetical protein
LSVAGVVCWDDKLDIDEASAGAKVNLMWPLLLARWLGARLDE